MKTSKKALLIFGVILGIMLIVIVAFRNISFKNDYIMVDQVNGSMELQVPKFSFDFRESDNNISIKNLRSNRVIKNEVEGILETYTKISCGGKDYYYDEKHNYTIIDYGINNHFIFNTLYMKYNNYNYCDYLKLQEYTTKLGGYARMHTFGREASENKSISVMLLIGTFDKVISFTAELIVKNGDDTLERSSGVFVIENNKFVYTRTDISEKSTRINIPEVSTFTLVGQGVLSLDDKYLIQFERDIVLK